MIVKFGSNVWIEVKRLALAISYGQVGRLANEGISRVISAKIVKKARHLNLDIGISHETFKRAGITSG